jgi:hypothetical protein
VIIKGADENLKSNEQDRSYGRFCEVMGDAFLALALHMKPDRGYLARLRDAIRQYQRALVFYEQRGDDLDAEGVGVKKTNAQRLDPARAEQGSEVSQDEKLAGKVAIEPDTRELVPSLTSSRLRLAAAAFVVTLLVATAAVSYPLLHRWQIQIALGQTPKAPTFPPAPPTQPPRPETPPTIPTAPPPLPTPDQRTKAPTTPQPPEITASIPLVFSSASLSCGKAPPIFWKFGDANLIEADPVPLEVTSCHLTSASCESPIVIGVGTASVKGTNAAEKDRALSRGANLALVLAGDVKRHCGPSVSVSSYVLNLGRFGDDQKGDKPDQRAVIALIGKGPDTDAAVAIALQKFAQSRPWSPHYTVCDLYKMNGSGPPAPVETQTEICGDQPNGTASLQ